ncbi:MAG: hypothetical protein E7077_01465 [Bacteroidales bacterium]|jgi:beta-lactamase superfamily II metal-dependent hydrolase|nr:hypothetical protein [Bacteroidales bacterium]
MKEDFKKTFKVSSFENLIVSIFVIGYKNIGESIVVLFRDVHDNVDETIMSMVIDSYENGNLTRKILKKYNVNKLDFVCWTHPHVDHSQGIDALIKNYFHDDIVIFVPKFYFGNLTEDVLASESAQTPQIFGEIWNLVEKNKNIKEIWRSISAFGDATNIYPMQLYSDDLYSKDVCFYFLTPLGSRTDKHANKGNQLSKPNELSISFVMSIDGYDFYFGGDTENEHAKGIKKDIVKSMRWIKVPHHCSLGAKYIADNIGPQFDFAASTVYKKSGLPKTEIQEIYAKNGTLHMTQLNETKTYRLKYDYGIIQYDYHFSDFKINVDITTYANAQEYTSTISRMPADDEN